MSEVQKPVEEQPAASVEATPVAEPATEAKAEETAAPATEETTTAAEPAKDEEPAAATEVLATTTKAAAQKKEFTGEGILGYKAPGGNFIKKLAGFQKKYFWFGSEPVESKSLSSYLRGEKPEIANHNAAWSSQTGKGLLYFSKFASEKATPAGIINLADISDIIEDGTVDFFFISHGSKHVFQASTLTERESWVAALKTNSAEAKEIAEGIKSSDGYKEQHSSLSKPATVAPVAAAAAAAATGKEPETKKEEKAEAKEEKKEEKARKSRSASRKRNSILGNFGLGSKKDEPAEHKEEKKIEPKEASSAEATTTEAATAPLDAPAVAAAVVAAPAADEPTKTEAATPAPAETAKPVTPANKRNSIFGSFPKFGQKKSVSEAKPSEVAPPVPAKDTEVVQSVSAEAPVIPAPEASEPLAAAVASPATVPVTEMTNGVTETEEAKPEVKTETKTEPVQKRKSSLPFGFGTSKDKKDDVEGDKPKSSPFAKFRQTIKGRTSPKAAEKAPEKTPEKAPEKAEEPATEPPVEDSAATTEAIKTSEPVVSEPISAAPAAAPQVSATA